MLHLKLSKKLPYLLFFLCSVMASSEQAHHKAHEHGHAKLEVMFDGKTLKTNFEIPASNVVGFEHRAKNPTEKKTLQDAIALLEKAAAVVSSPECQQQSQSVKLLQEGASHAEFEIQIELSCPKIPKNIEVTLFQTLSTLKLTETLISLDYEYQGPKTQSAGSLNHKDIRLKL